MNMTIETIETTDTLTTTTVTTGLLAGKIVFITGAGCDIGAAAARLFAQEGAAHWTVMTAEAAHAPKR